MTVATANGRPDRKQLSDQLDRLDRVIDLLAANLNEAVADACQEGARLAVKDAVLELLTNPDLRAVVAGLAPAVTPAAPPPPTETTPETRAGRWPRLRERARAAGASAVTRVAAAAAVVGTARLLTAVMPVRRFLAIGAGVGVAVGVVSYLCPPAVSAVASGVGGAGVAVAAQVGRWLRRAAPYGTPAAS